MSKKEIILEPTKGWLNANGSKFALCALDAIESLQSEVERLEDEKQSAEILLQAAKEACEIAFKEVRYEKTS